MCSYKYFADKSLIVSRCSSSFPCVACAIPNLSTVRVDHNTSRSRIDWKWLKWNSISTRKHIRGYECWMHCCTVYNLYNNLYNMYITLDASRISIWQIQSGFFPRWPGHSSKVASSFDKSPPSWKQTSGVCNWHQLLVNLIILWIRITSISMNHLAKLPLWKILYFSFIVDVFNVFRKKDTFSPRYQWPIRWRQLLWLRPQMDPLNWLLCQICRKTWSTRGAAAPWLKR